VLSLDEALERLRSPFFTEEFSPLTGAPLLCVDFSLPSAAPSQGALDAARAALARLAAPSVALHPAAAAPHGASLAGAFDVLLDAEVDLVRIAQVTREQPLASLALVQLLRMGGQLDVTQALVAESFTYSTLQSGPEFARWLDGRPPPPAAARGDGEAVRAERWNDTLVVTLSRPERHNAFGRTMRDGLCAALAIARADPELEVVVRGRGPSFCSGGDLDEFGSLADPASAHALRATRNAAQAVADLADRIRFEVHGACIGAGVELPAFASRVVAAEDACFELPELRFGLVPGAGGTVSLPRRIGRQRTAWLALTGRRIDAPTAQQWGLVDEIVLRRPGAEDDDAEPGAGVVSLHP